MEVCVQEAPPFFDVTDLHKAACYLYKREK